MAFSSPQGKMHALSLTNFKAELSWVKDLVLKVSFQRNFQGGAVAGLGRALPITSVFS